MSLHFKLPPAHWFCTSVRTYVLRGKGFIALSMFLTLVFHWLLGENLLVLVWLLNSWYCDIPTTKCKIQVMNNVRVSNTVTVRGWLCRTHESCTRSFSLTCEGVSVSLMGWPSNRNRICLIASPCVDIETLCSQYFLNDTGQHLGVEVPTSTSTPFCYLSSDN